MLSLSARNYCKLRDKFHHFQYIYRYICGSVIHRNDIIVLLKPGTTGNMMSDVHSLLNVYQCNKEGKTSRAM